VRSTPSFFASAEAPAFSCTKKGLLRVEIDRPILVLEELDEPELHAVAVRASEATTAAVTVIFFGLIAASLQVK
jgi:hypothetical protein